MDDPSPAVREASVEFLVSFDELKMHTTIFQAVLARLSDSAISVRKRIIKLISERLKSSDSPDEAAYLQAMLIEQTCDDFGDASDLAFTCILDSWIVPVLRKRHLLVEQGDLVKARHELAEFTAQIIRVIRLVSQLSSFQTLVSKIALSAEHGMAFKQVAQLVVDLLFETLVTSLEESNNSAVKFILGALVNLVGPTAGGGSLGTHFNLLCSLILFEDSDTVEYALKLVKIAQSGDGRFLFRQATNLTGNLTKLVFRGSEEIVRSSLECLFEIGTVHASTRGQLEGIYRKLSSFITAHSQASIASQHTALMARAILALGIITRLGTEHDFVWETISVERTIDTILLVRSIAEAPAMMIFSAMAISELMQCAPLCTLQEPLNSTIKADLTSPIDGVRLAHLRGLLLLISKDSSATDLQGFTESSTAKLDFGSSICTVVQNFAQSIVESATCRNEQIVSLSAILLASILRKGLSHPQQLIPAILSLRHVPFSGIASRLTAICKEVLEHHENYIGMSLEAILQKSYRIAAFFGQNGGFIVDANGNILSTVTFIYESFKAKSKRLDILNALFRELDTERTDLAYFQYLLEALAELPFRLQEEVTYAIRRLQELVAVRDEEMLLNHVETLLRTYYLLRTQLYLCTVYKISPAQVEDFQAPSKDQICKRTRSEAIDLNRDLSIENVDPERIKASIEDITFTLSKQERSTVHGDRSNVENNKTVKTKRPYNRRKRSKLEEVIGQMPG